MSQIKRNIVLSNKQGNNSAMGIFSIEKLSNGMFGTIKVFNTDVSSVSVFLQSEGKQILSSQVKLDNSTYSFRLDNNLSLSSRFSCVIINSEKLEPLLWDSESEKGYLQACVNKLGNATLASSSELRDSSSNYQPDGAPESTRPTGYDQSSTAPRTANGRPYSVGDNIANSTLNNSILEAALNNSQSANYYSETPINSSELADILQKTATTDSSSENLSNTCVLRNSLNSNIFNTGDATYTYPDYDGLGNPPQSSYDAYSGHDNVEEGEKIDNIGNDATQDLQNDSYSKLHDNSSNYQSGGLSRTPVPTNETHDNYQSSGRPVVAPTNSHRITNDTCRGQSPYSSAERVFPNPPQWHNASTYANMTSDKDAIKLNDSMFSQTLNDASQEPVKAVNLDELFDISPGELESLVDAAVEMNEEAEPIHSVPKPKNGEIFFDLVSDQIEDIFAKNQSEETLEQLIPSSKWAKVSYDDSTKDYVIGLIYNDIMLKYICYGVYNAELSSAPKSMDGFAQWLPLNPDHPQGSGYWVMYQDAVTGDNIKIDHV